MDMIIPRGVAHGAPVNTTNISAGFLRVSRSHVTGMMFVIASCEPSSRFEGFTPARKFTRNDFFFHAAPANYVRDQDYTYATPVVPVMPQDLQSFQGRVLTEAQRAGRVSPTYLAVTTRRADAMRILIASTGSRRSLPASPRARLPGRQARGMSPTSTVHAAPTWSG